MSQRDVVAEIRAAQPEIPFELRERVRLIAAAAPPERQSRFTRRRVFAVLIPVAAAVAVAAVVTRPAHHAAVPQPFATDQAHTPGTVEGTARQSKAVAVPGAANPAASAKLSPLSPSATRPQKYSASLTLRVPNATAVSNATKRAVAIVTGLGGYVVSAHVNAASAAASSDLVLKVPKTNVRQAVARLSSLGTITAEQVDIQDLQAGIATSDRTMQRLQRQLAALRAQPSTPAIARQITALTTRIERLQRAEAATLRAARYATVSLHLATPAPAVPKHHGHGPLHGLGVAFRWIGIGAVYALALGVPTLVLLALGWLAVRTIRRRRETALLSRP
jgi:uncharacterized coiled-coil protein SlyX